MKITCFGRSVRKLKQFYLLLHNVKFFSYCISNDIEKTTDIFIDSVCLFVCLCVILGNQVLCSVFKTLSYNTKNLVNFYSHQLSKCSFPLFTISLLFKLGLKWFHEIEVWKVICLNEITLQNANKKIIFEISRGKLKIKLYIRYGHT